MKGHQSFLHSYFFYIRYSFVELCHVSDGLGYFSHTFVRCNSKAAFDEMLKLNGKIEYAGHQLRTGKNFRTPPIEKFPMEEIEILQDLMNKDVKHLEIVLMDMKSTHNKMTPELR